LPRREPGRKRVLNVEDWAEIRRLSKGAGLSINEIVRQLGGARAQRFFSIERWPCRSVMARANSAGFSCPSVSTSSEAV
jgi:hypothetical protein